MDGSLCRYTYETACCFFFFFWAKYTKILAKLVELTLEKPNFSKFYFANFFFEKWRKKNTGASLWKCLPTCVCLQAFLLFLALRGCVVAAFVCVFFLSPSSLIAVVSRCVGQRACGTRHCQSVNQASRERGGQGRHLTKTPCCCCNPSLFSLCAVSFFLLMK